MGLASLKEVKEFFGVTNSATFTKEWRELSEDERAKFRGLVGEAIGKEEGDTNEND